MTNEKRPAEADRDDLQKLTRRVEKLEKEYLFLLKEITAIHQSDLEWGTIFQTYSQRSLILATQASKNDCPIGVIVIRPFISWIE